MPHRKRRAGARRATHPERPAGTPRAERPAKGDGRALAAVESERSKVARPFFALIVVDVVLMGAGPLCAVLPLPFVCASLRDAIWVWFAVMLGVNAFLGSLGGRFIRLTLERRRLAREVRPSTS